jgi:NAD(P)-dependent dehydrogenase (short-subunit alcohol dehydrogenase family)
VDSGCLFSNLVVWVLVLVQVDVQHALQVENLVTRTVSEFGRLDIIVNNAGVFTDPTPCLKNMKRGMIF